MHNYFKDASMLILWEIMIIIFMLWPITDKLLINICFLKKKNNNKYKF